MLADDDDEEADDSDEDLDLETLMKASSKRPAQEANKNIQPLTKK